MRLGRIIIQLCALFIAAALAFGGYAYMKERSVRVYKETVLQGLQVSSLNGVVTALKTAPSMVCTEDHSDFNSASRVTSYHDEGMTRLTFTSLTDGKSQYWIIRDEEIYVWSDESEAILRIRAGGDSSVKELGDLLPPLFVNAQCSVWWKPNPRAFDIPASKPIIEYER